MGGRGSSARMPYEYTYKCVGYIEGVKVLEPINTAWRGNKRISTKLPEESHASSAYIKLSPQGNFSQYREYDENHQITLEIGYHREAKLDKHAPAVLHIHIYKTPGDFSERTPRFLTPQEFQKYKKFFVGLNL